MAYNKKNWQDNVSDITAAELNRMEQGIYDNSLVVDAVTDKLNPTDTETYKTAELTEGQITDVIGVNDILIKGQTSQNGEPTPSSPVDVNVVSGSNVINTSNKNLFNPTYTFSEKGVTSVIINQQIKWNGTSSGGQTYKMADINMPIGTYKITLDVISGTHDNSKHIWLDFYNNNTKVANNNWSTSGIRTNTLNSSVNAIYLGFDPADTFNNFTFRMQIEKDTATTYEPHQGKELPLDLPVENLCTTYNFANATILNDGQIYEGTDRFATDYIKVTVNTQYILHFKDNSNINFYGVAYYDANKTFISRNTKNGGNNLTFTTDSNTVYIRVFGQPQIGTIFTEESFNTYKIQLEQGSKANAYTPYGTDPIELCKIGDYQDYFYKSGSKWYLHKEIGKAELSSTNQQWVITETSISGKNRYRTNNYLNIIKKPSSAANMGYVLCNYYTSQVAGTAGSWGGNQGISEDATGSIFINDDNYLDNLNSWTNWLDTVKPSLYFVLDNSTNTEITDTTLINQLNAIYNAPLYEQTNITQENNDLPMILDITACKDNINGIKAWIRK